MVMTGDGDRDPGGSPNPAAASLDTTPITVPAARTGGKSPAARSEADRPKRFPT